MDLSNIDIWPFTALAAVLVISPGPDLLLVINSALHKRVMAGVLTALGVSLGVFLWSCFAGLGLVATLLANQLMFSSLTLLGAVCLLFVGLSEIRAAMAAAKSSETVAAQYGTSYLSCFSKGLMVNLSNPKVGVFYVAVLPQFVEKDHLGIGSALILGGIHIALGLVWFILCAVFVDAAQAMLRNRRFVNRVQTGAGVILLMLALILIARNMIAWWA